MKLGHGEATIVKLVGACERKDHNCTIENDRGLFAMPEDQKLCQIVVRVSILIFYLKYY